MRRRGARERVSRSEGRRQWQAAEVPLMQFTGPVGKLELAAFGGRVVGFASTLPIAEVPLMQFTGLVGKLELVAFGERVRVARSRWRRSPAAVTA